MPRTSQQAVNRVANQLSDKLNSAGSNSSACLGDYEDYVHYSLGKQYGGDAKRIYRKPWMNRKNVNTTGNSQNNFNRRRLSPRWMQGVKGCFVCGEDHRANTRH